MSEGVLSRRVPWTRKPGVFVEVDRANPWAKGCIGAYLMLPGMETRDSSGVGVVPGTAAAKVGTLTHKTKFGAPVLSFPGGANGTNYLTIPLGGTRPLAALQVIWYGSFPSAISGNTTVFEVSNAADATDACFIWTASGTARLTLRDGGSDDNHIGRAAWLDEDTDRHQWAQGFSAQTYYWKDGVEDDTPDSGGAVGSPNDGSLEVFGNSGVGSFVDLEIDAELILVFDNWSDDRVVALKDNPYRIFQPRIQRIPTGIAVAGITAALTGTMIAGGVLESEIAAGGETVIIDLTGDTWIAAGDAAIGDEADTQALIDGFDAATSPATGWNNEVRDKEPVTIVTRNSDTKATLLFTTAASAYDISADETITVTIPAAVLVTSGDAIEADDTFVVTNEGVAVGVPNSLMMMGVGI